ncbi:fatty acid desaturase [Roseovarius sp. 2305UL8-3]|uniref:fatty acid desaturase n=1 Tax=Roseovarius conchicola TaxID=3121636 RepID=UPI003527DFFA
MCPQEPTPKGVKWHDLTGMTPARTLHELLLPLPWLSLSLVLYASPLWMAGPLASFMFFLCALRLNHEAIHGNLGLSRRGDNRVMHVLSALMCGSNHADAYCHLKHHKHAMGPEDHEGKCSHMSAGQVLLYGPRFPVDLNLAAWRSGSPKWRRLVLIDWIGVVAVVAMILLSGQWFLMLHLAAMATAQCLTAFFAVWITHQGTAHTGVAGRSQRGPLARVAYLMFYHREHHLFPKVPVHRLPVLAARLDRDVPGYARTRQPVMPTLDWG